VRDYFCLILHEYMVISYSCSIFLFQNLNICCQRVYYMTQVEYDKLLVIKTYCWKVPTVSFDNSLQSSDKTFQIFRRTFRPVIATYCGGVLTIHFTSDCWGVLINKDNYFPTGYKKLLLGSAHCISTYY
jgi:hypothetical protein